MPQVNLEVCSLTGMLTMVCNKISTALFVSLLLACTSCVAPKVVTQENSVIDIIGPVIAQESDEIGVAGETQLFAVVVTDNIGVAEVVLSYRFDDGEEEFINSTMILVGADKYQASVESKPINSKINYFITAKDESGLEVFRGSPAAPLTRNLMVPVNAIEQTEPLSLSTKAKLKTLFFAPNGLLDSGVIAASGGLIGGTGPCPMSGCGVSFNVSQPWITDWPVLGAG